MFRRAMWWPPVVSLINVIVRGPSIDGAARRADALTFDLRPDRHLTLISRRGSTSDLEAGAVEAGCH